MGIVLAWRKPLKLIEARFRQAEHSKEDKAAYG
jgi:hypothetical protein